MNSPKSNADFSVSPTTENALDQLQLNTIQQLEQRCKNLESQLTSVEERFNYMQKATQDALWDWDLQKNTGWYSEGLRTLSGYDPAQIGDGVSFWYENIHPDDKDRVTKSIHLVIDNGGKNWSDRYRFKRADGTYCWILDRGYALHDATGRPIRMVGSMQDISKEIDALEALRKSEEHLRLAIDSASLGTWDFNPVTGVLQWDDRCKELFGLAPNDHTDYEIFLKGLHPDDREITHRANQDVLSGTKNREYDIEYRTIGIRDNRLRWIRAKGRSYFDDRGICYRYAGTVIDITEQKMREVRLAEQEQRFRMLATMIPQIVWTTDANGVVDFITDKWEDYTGHRPTYELFSFRELMHDEDRKTVVEAWNKARKEGETFRTEYRLKNLNTNEYKWFSSTTAPLKDEKGNVVRWIGSATDIHDQKLLEHRLEERVAKRTKELHALNARLERSNTELEQYAYVTSHDLKEPLRKVQFYSNRVSQKFGDTLPEEVHKYLTRIESSAVRMTSLINDLLSYSRLSQSDSPLENVNLNQIVSNVLNDFELLCEEKKVTIETDELPAIHAIRLQMQQLFSNLIGNSIKFSKPRIPNRIRISCEDLSVQEKEQRFDLSPETHYYKFVIRDEGIGFNKKFNEQIFAIFHRLNDRNGIEGHGIGLALCRKIVNSHQGIIFATGEEGVGTTITIILPKE